MVGPRRAIIAGHGAFPAGLVSAVEQITGEQDALVAFSNAGLAREAIEAGLRALVEGGIGVVFTDLPGGSATLAARRIARDHPDLTLVTGANLAALIDFVLTDPSLTCADAARRAAERGRAALDVHRG